MDTRIVSPSRAQELQVVLKAAKAGTLKCGQALHKVEAQGNVMLVDPVNGEPFIFVAPETVHVFQSKPGSGTDHLRQRTLAGMLFEQLSWGLHVR
jgi:hypothetical protein